METSAYAGESSFDTADVKDGGKTFSRTLTVLLAEDEPTVRRVITRILQQGGHEVIAVRNGEAAVDTFTARRHEIDFLLFDLIMPQMTGWKAYREIARMQPGIPHLFMSGYMWDTGPEEELPELAEELVIRKPFSPSDLLRMVEKLRSAGRKRQFTQLTKRRLSPATGRATTT